MVNNTRVPRLVFCVNAWCYYFIIIDDSSIVPPRLAVVRTGLFFCGMASLAIDQILSPDRYGGNRRENLLTFSATPEFIALCEIGLLLAEMTACLVAQYGRQSVSGFTYQLHQTPLTFLVGRDLSDDFAMVQYSESIELRLVAPLFTIATSKKILIVCILV